MSAITPPVVFELHMARSRLLDAYNAADLALRNRLRALHLDEKPLIAQNIELLAKTPAGPQYSKAAKKRADDRLQELRDLQPVRCDVVHSRMQLLHVEGVPHALFSNVQKHAHVGMRGLLLTLEDLKHCESVFSAVANEFERADFTQPAPCVQASRAIVPIKASSPPPPSPAAASGP